MLTEFKSLSDGHLLRVDQSRHSIDLTNDKVKKVYSAPSQAENRARRFAAMEIDRHLAEGVILPVDNKLVVAIVFAPKRNISPRLCVAHCKLNVVATHVSYSLPLVGEFSVSAGEVIVFSTPYTNCERWQIGMDERDHDKTVFTSPYKQYWFGSIPFGLNKAVMIFRRGMDVIPASVFC